MSGRTDVGTVDDLHASAVKACGLDDFGVDDDNYREALGVLLDSFRRDADLTELGSKMHRFFVRNALVARLVSEAAFKQYPKYVDVPIERPIFVTGLPRTGTTLIHRLLTADPAHQGLELWLAEFPQPRPPRETWSDNPVFAQLDATGARYVLGPAIRTVPENKMDSWGTTPICSSSDCCRRARTSSLAKLTRPRVAS